MAMMQDSLLALSTHSKLETNAAMLRHLLLSATDFVHHRTLWTGAASTAPADSQRHVSPTSAKVTRCTRRMHHLWLWRHLHLPNKARTRSACMLSGLVSRSAERRFRRCTTLFISDGANSKPLPPNKQTKKKFGVVSQYARAHPVLCAHAPGKRGGGSGNSQVAPVHR